MKYFLLLFCICVFACNAQTQKFDYNSDSLVFMLEDHHFHPYDTLGIDYSKDSNLYKMLIEEFSNLKPMDYTPNVKASRGFVGIKIQGKTGDNKMVYQVIYTTYDGVVFRKEVGMFDEKYFKNNTLERIISYTLVNKHL